MTYDEWVLARHHNARERSVLKRKHPSHLVVVDELFHANDRLYSSLFDIPLFDQQIVNAEAAIASDPEHASASLKYTLEDCLNIHAKLAVQHDAAKAKIAECKAKLEAAVPI